MSEISAIVVNYIQVNDITPLPLAQGDIIQVSKNGIVEKEYTVPTGKSGNVNITIQGKLE